MKKKYHLSLCVEVVVGSDIHISLDCPEVEIDPADYVVVFMSFLLVVDLIFKQFGCAIYIRELIWPSPLVYKRGQAKGGYVNKWKYEMRARTEGVLSSFIGPARWYMLIATSSQDDHRRMGAGDVFGTRTRT